MTEKEFAQVFSKNLVTQMRRRGLAQVDVAHYLNISEASVSKWLSGRSFPRVSRLDDLCRLFKCSRADLINENTSDETAGAWTLDHVRLLELFDELNEEGKHYLLEQAKMIVSYGRYSKKNNTVEVMEG